MSLVKQGVFYYFLSPREHAENESIALNFSEAGKYLQIDHW